MRTAQKWLALPDDKLALELGRVFTPEGEWKHDFHQYEIEDQHVVGPCKKCKASYPQKRNSSCSVPDPIKLDWDTAMKWFRQHSPRRAILRQLCGPVPIDCVSWFLVSAQPKHYLIAAAIAAEGAKHG